MKNNILILICAFFFFSTHLQASNDIVDRAKFLRSEARKIFDAANVKKDQLLKSEYETFLHTSIFKELNKYPDEGLSFDEVVGAGLHCGLFAFVAADGSASQQYECKSQRSLNNFFNTLRNGKSYVSLADLKARHPDWNQIIQHRTTRFFKNGHLSRSLDEIAQKLLVESERNIPKKRLEDYEVLLANADFQVSAEQWVWEDVFIQLDTDNTGSIDVLEYSKGVSKTNLVTLPVAEFVKMVDKENQQSGNNDSFLGRDFFIGFTHNQRGVPLPTVGPAIPTPSTGLPNLYKLFSTDTQNITINISQASSKEQAKEIINRFLQTSLKEELEKAKKASKNANALKVRYIKNLGIVLTDSLMVKNGKIDVNFAQTVVALRVLSDYTNFSETPKKASFAWNKTTNEDGESSNHTTADVALRIDWYDPFFWDYLFAPEIVSGGLGYSRSGDGIENNLNQSKFVFIVGNYNWDLSKQWWNLLPNVFTESSMAMSLQWAEQETRTVSSKVVTKIRYFDKDSLSVVLSPAINLGFMKLGKENWFDKDRNWKFYANPSFGVVKDKISHESFAITQEPQEEAEDDLSYKKAIIEIGLEYQKHLSLVYSRTRWKDFTKTDKDFNFEQLKLEWKPQGFDNIAFSYTYKKGIENTEEEFAKTQVVGLDILF